MGERVVVIGAGLAGCEAAYQLARRGVPVALYEMRPGERSAAHQGDDFAELVCSNSFRARALENAVGLLKEELRRLGSLVMESADQSEVPAGRALAVDRNAFARHVTERTRACPGIEVRNERVDRLPEAPLAILATGPLTAAPLANELAKLCGTESLYFYDAISPIVYADSIDPEVAFRASRWEDGGDYLNLPLDRTGYEAFVADLVAADRLALHPAEAALYFEGCLPIEEMARRGPRTLAFGPMKSVGIRHPRTGERPWAVVQLRQEDKCGVLYNLVGCQTRLRIPEQQRVFRSLPGLGGAVFARYGSVHRNTYVNAPACLLPSLELRARPGLYVAGQLSGVEGYLESAAVGFLAGVFAAHAWRGAPLPSVPPTSALGALLRHLREADPRHFTPMNVNYGLFPALAEPPRERRARNRALAERSLADLHGFAAEIAA
jgi:methylenetetrahydrofolate--tRNA-(uracil-5-)-methyltransferase